MNDKKDLRHVNDFLRHSKVMKGHLDRYGLEGIEGVPEVGEQMLFDALCMRLSAAYESLSQTSEEFRHREFGKPLKEIRATRNYISHKYSDLTWPLIRETVLEHHSQMVIQLQKYASPENKDDEYC